jgi:hypothetical protein
MKELVVLTAISVLQVLAKSLFEKQLAVASAAVAEWLRQLFVAKSSWVHQSHACQFFASTFSC